MNKSPVEFQMYESYIISQNSPHAPHQSTFTADTDCKSPDNNETSSSMANNKHFQQFSNFSMNNCDIKNVQISSASSLSEDSEFSASSELSTPMAPSMGVQQRLSRNF